MAAFLALCFFCRRRSRRSKAAKRRDLPTSDDESDIWSRDKHHGNSFKGPTERTRDLGTKRNTAAAPLMSHPSNRHSLFGSNNNQNSYEPAPPTRYFTSGADGQEDDSTAYNAHPYSPDHVQSYGHDSEPPSNNYHERDALAAGVGGAALGGLAAHAADRHQVRHSDSLSRNGAYTEDEHNTLPEAAIGSGHRRSDSVSRASVKERWPFMDSHERKSNDSTRARSRSFSRGRDQLAMHEQEPHDRHLRPSDAALAGSAVGGGPVGVAVARGTGQRSPHRKGILKQTSSNPTSAPVSPDENGAIRPITSRDSGPHELESSEVPTPGRTSREQRRHSPLGSAAPVAAVGANRSPTRSRQKSWSNSSTRSNVRPNPMLNESSQDSDIPLIPSRSPRRNSIKSNARYSTANEGTAELPAHENGQLGIANREFVSPNLDPRRASMDNEAVVSPISPVDTSLPSTWSNAQAKELGMDPAGVAAKSSSQESTNLSYSPLNSNSTASSSSTEHSSGLVSAIQRIFHSQKQLEESPTVAPPRRSFGDRTLPVSENLYDDDHHRVPSVPHRKPAPAMIAQHAAQYGDIISSNNVNTTGVPASANTSNMSRSRSTARPGYGIGSGDPFDLARTRTDSNMTGVSLSNYTEPTRNTGAIDTNNSYREPTLAELRREVQEEDRQRQRGMSWNSTGRHGNTARKSVEGQRYGNDGELFDRAVPESESHDHFYGQGVGTAY